MNENKFDKMMKSYCDRGTIPFEFKEKRNTLKYTSVLAASLVFAILATMLFFPGTGNKNDFTLTVSAAETKMNSEVGAYTTEIDFYSKDGYFLDHQEMNQIVIGISGDNISDISMKSLNHFNQFFLIEGDIANSYDYNGNLSNDYNVNEKDYANMEPTGELIVNSEILYNSDAVVTSDSNGKDILYYMDIEETDITNDKAYTKELCLMCTPIDENGYYLSRDDFSSKYDDIVEIIVKFDDDTTLKKYVSISYMDGLLYAKETTL